MDRHFEILCICFCSYRYLLTTALVTTLYMSKGRSYGICKGAWSSSGLQYLAYSKVVTLAQITQCNFICNSTNNSYFDYVGLTTEEIQQCFWRGMKSTSIHFVIRCYSLKHLANCHQTVLQNADPVMTSNLDHGICVLNHRLQCPNSYMRFTIATWCLFNNEENSSWWLYVDAGVTFQDNLRIVGPYSNDRMIKANE